MVRILLIILISGALVFGLYFGFKKSGVSNFTELVRNTSFFVFPKKSFDPEIVLKFTGDNIPARSVNFLTTKSGDFTWAYKNIADDLKDADLTIVNLEAPLIKDCPLTNEGFTFCGDARNVAGLSLAGIDVVGMANNHAGNYGREGLSETIKNLDSVEILSSGMEERQIAYKKIHNTQFAFLAFDAISYSGAGVLEAKEDLMKKLILEAKTQADFVVVQMHWGTEYTRNPNEYQKRMGRFLIDNGVDLVVGNHPHWVQDYEIYNGKYIFYALGNFIFDQEWSQKTKEGVIAKVTIQDKKVLNVEFIPVEIKNYGQVFKSNKFEIVPKLLK